jgi:DNA (cytosine-5)-methyltransferase 1
VGVAYYNEKDPFAAEWLRKLVAANMIAPGDVDERSIEDVIPLELAKYTQCHFFAGIGGWSRAARLAGLPDSEPIWTGSCPCQPFSGASQGTGFADERHLWPAFFHLIEQCRPSVVFGEQVESAVKWGWLDLVQSDMEGADYAFGAAILPACSVGAPHERQRIFFVAHANRNRNEPRHNKFPCATEEEREARGPIQVGGPMHSTFWDDHVRAAGNDGKQYLLENRPGAFPLVNGLSEGVGRLRAYGNAIVPQVAAELIKVAMEYAP